MSSHAPPDYDCPFCRNIRTGEGDHPLEIVHRGATVFVKINPRWRLHNPGSVLVIPVDHYENIFDLPDTLSAPIHAAARSAATAMKAAFGCDGISLRQHNEPAGSQNVWHYHLHVIPRWHGDGLDQHPAAVADAEEIRHRAQQLRAAWPTASATKAAAANPRTGPASTLPGCASGS